MRINYNSMTIYIMDDYEGMSGKAAQMLVAQVTLKSNSVLGLATGSTPIGMYRRVVELYKGDEVDFSDVVTFNLDEYYPIDPQNEQSYAYYMNYHLFDHINISKQHIHIPDGMSKDVVKTCESYDQSIEKANNIDFQVLGIGNNGHIGFNEPDVHFEAGTHLVQLDEMTVSANARFFDSKDHVPRQAISMGIRNIMHSKKIILLASGTTKSGVIKDMLFEDVTPNLPASILQLHNDVTLILDKEASRDLIAALNQVKGYEGIVDKIG